MNSQFRCTIGVTNCNGLNNWIQLLVNHYTINSISGDAFTRADIGRSKHVVGAASHRQPI